MRIIQLNRHRAQLRHSKDILCFSQMQPKPFGKRALAGCQEHHRRLVHRRAREGRTTPIRDIRLTRQGLIDRQSRLFGRQKPIECSLIGSASGIGPLRRSLIAHGLIGTTDPIPRTAKGNRGLHGLFKEDEMLKREPVFVEIPQGDIPREPFKLCEVAAVNQPMLCRNFIGLRSASFPHLGPREYQTPFGPNLGIAQGSGFTSCKNQFGGFCVSIFTHPPQKPLIGQSRIIGEA